MDEFLKAHGLSADNVDIDRLLGDFRSEMEKGLAGEDSSLAMIPTFIDVDKDVPAGEPVIVIDAGGTNLRIATITFGDDGKPQIDDFSKYQMPGIERELTADEFFGQLAEYLRPVIGKSDKIGFCFSYPAEIAPDRDGKLIRWTKEIKVPSVVGEYIGKGLLGALGEAGEGKKIAILNDTIATLLAGKATAAGQSYESYIGFILGTGTNMAYVEKNSNITKRNDLDAAGSQAINVESGNFGLAPRGDLDEELDADTLIPGEHKFEKMISGLYISNIMLRSLKAAVAEGLFSDECAGVISSIDELSGRDVDDFLDNRGAGPLVNDSVVGEDAEKIRQVLEGLYARAAKLTAVNISSAVLKSGAGTDPSKPVCINIDGSTYYKACGVKEKTEAYLSEILGGRGISYDLVHADDAPMIGAAVAGITN
ncbi:hypothetical protein BVX94_04050 [bacterium B17]|nr:hypothetical protein BVX94_04050 [bacterium B17]